MLLGPDNVGIAIGISLLSCIYTEIFVISYPLPVTGRHLWFLTHPDVGQYSIVPPYCSTKNYAISVEISHRLHSICNIRYKHFSFHVRHFDFRLNAGRILRRAMLLPATVTLTSSKQMRQRWICCCMWFTPFYSMVTKFITFSQRNHPLLLHFRWRHLIMGWTIFENLNISTRSRPIIEYLIFQPILLA